MMEWKKHIALTNVLSFKNVKVRYKNSILGFFWSMLHPFILLGIFVTVFSQAFVHVENYALFALTGIIFWIYFSTSTTQILSSLLENSSILKSIKVPAIVFPVSTSFASLINLLLSFIPYSILAVFLGIHVSIHFLWIIPLLITFTMFIFGFALILSSLNVYFRDISLLWNSIIPAFFYFTPIVYPIDIVPEKYHWIMKLNPLFHYIESFKMILLENMTPPNYMLLASTGIALFFTGFGLFVFFKLEKGFISNY